MDHHRSRGDAITPYSVFPDHLRLTVRLTPNASRDALEGSETMADGGVVLKARVTAVPEGGKANGALIQLLSRSLRIPKSAIMILSGDTARKKILRIEGDPEDLIIKLERFVTR